MSEWHLCVCNVSMMIDEDHSLRLDYADANKIARTSMRIDDYSFFPRRKTKFAGKLKGIAKLCWGLVVSVAS